MAAPESQNKKRKGATDAQPKAKKARKQDDVATAQEKPVKAPKSPKTVAAATVTVTESQKQDEEPKKTKKTKKVKIVESNGDEAALEVEEVKEKPKKTKKSKKSEPEEEVEEAPVAVEKKSKKASKSKKQDEAPDAVAEESLAVSAGDDEEDTLDDQTAALLAGFESERDESDLEKEDEDFNENALPEISKKKLKELEKARQNAEPGVIYLGRIPHGFFESQMKKYFGQFGTVRRLRLSRNKKTGASKHYAFIEFANGEVAEIVAKTMHNYLMFGHILQCRVIPQEQVHADLFKGANERFKVDPRNKKAGAAMSRGAQREVWEKRVASENKKRTGKAKGLKEEFGYSFEAPAVKPVDTVSKKMLEDAPAQQPLTVEEADPELAGGVVVTEPVAEKKSKVTKGKKRKSDIVPEAVEEPAAAAPAKKAKKAKKSKA